ncbi:MAG: cbb3-type cytochrome c oxidase subunit 3 [Rhodovarius sp.]|nr:cbb3-type cytochrome c oxidase subunit 3 [Rhodovarius sp.]MCX7932742.1 cbb3-type cytochrome c oxidase subunit 3 [Rhodovarius sp.]MDW8315303.1 cbb3-type cytochrome c oxidase subunit 3 [Rhodovarius sp.]
MLETLAEHQSLFSTLWVVWFFLLFIGILVWVLRPSQRRQLERHADIPLREER